MPDGTPSRTGNALTAEPAVHPFPLFCLLPGRGRRRWLEKDAQGAADHEQEAAPGFVPSPPFPFPLLSRCAPLSDRRAVGDRREVGHQSPSGTGSLSEATFFFFFFPFSPFPPRLRARSVHSGWAEKHHMISRRKKLEVALEIRRRGSRSPFFLPPTFPQGRDPGRRSPR